MDPYGELERGLRVQQLVGRPGSHKQWILKVILNVIFVVNIVRFGIMICYPEMSPRFVLMVGNLVGALGYNNSMMVLVSLFFYGIVTLIYMIIFEVAEYRGQKEFLTDTFHLEEGMAEWNLNREDEKRIKWVARLILRAYKMNIITSMISTASLVAVALAIRLKEADSGSQTIILILWFLFVCTFFPRITYMFFAVLSIQAISVYAIGVRYAAVNKSLANAKTDADISNFLDEHDRISLFCKSHDRAFKWMIAAVESLSMPAAAITVYGVVYTQFGSLFELTNGILYCCIVTSCTVLIIWIPSGAVRPAHASYNAAMSCLARIRMSHYTRRRLITFCKRISRRTVGQIGFSNGNTQVFDRIEAYEAISATVNLWFLYASMRQAVQ